MKSVKSEINEELVKFWTQSDGEPTKEELREFCAEQGITFRQGIARLTKAGLYKRKPYLTKAGTVPQTKLEIAMEIAMWLQVEDWQLEGLDDAPKRSLELLRDLVKELILNKPSSPQK